MSQNDDSISRKAAIEAVEKNACNTQRIMDAVNNLPSTQPEVIVLCADCIKRDKCKFYDTQGDGGYCRYGRDKDGRFNPQTAGD